MIVDVVMAIGIAILGFKIMLLESKLRSLEWRNDVQHRRYERDIMYLSREPKLHLNSVYGKLAYMDTDSIKVEKED